MLLSKTRPTSISSSLASSTSTYSSLFVATNVLPLSNHVLLSTDSDGLVYPRRYYFSHIQPTPRRRRFSSSSLLGSSTSSSRPIDFLSNAFLQIAMASNAAANESSTSSNETNLNKRSSVLHQEKSNIHSTTLSNTSHEYPNASIDSKINTAAMEFPSSNPFPTPIKVNLMPDSPAVVDFASKAFSCQTTDTTSQQNKNLATAAIADSLDSSISSVDPSTATAPFQVTPVASVSRKSKTKTKTSSPSSISNIIAPYVALTKPRLSALVVLSAMSTYALTTNDATLPQLLFLTLGTTLASSSANAINMAREYVYDGMMTRTRARPVVRGILTPTQAFTFAGISGIASVSALYFGVNSVVAFLGASNIVLYAGLYTTLKRKSISNTWVGAIVGAIPPLMGWAASSSLTDPGAWCFAALLYAWQFPHFNSLSHSIRDEYRSAGYVMTAWTDPALNARVALRYSALMFPICIGMSYFGLTDWVFSFDSSLVNGWLTYWAYQFWVEQRKVLPVAKHNGTLLDPSAHQYSGSSGNSGSYSSSARTNGFARKLFWGSVIHLPAILVLAMIHKKGQWDWLFGSSDDNSNISGQNNNTEVSSQEIKDQEEILQSS